MTAFEEGYKYFADSSSAVMASTQGGHYVQTVQSEIDALMESLNAMKGFKSDVTTLKGDVAEFWHAGTFDIDAALKGSTHRAFVDRSHDLGSVDVSTNFGDDYGLKYYRTGADSAKQQAKSIFERFKEYQSSGGKETLEDYLSKRGYTGDVILDDPIYSGQLRLIPSDQMEDAIKFLEQKIAKEQMIRPEQVKRYQETLDLLRDRIRDNQGNESISLSKEDAEKLAKLAKEGSIDASELGLTTEELMRYEYVLKQSFKAGLTAATISMVLKVAPEIISAIRYLIENGEVEADQFKRIGWAAVDGASEGFIKGTIASAITTCCTSGLWGEAMKKVDPTIIGMVTVIAFDSLKNAYKVATNQMSQREMANELIKEMFTITCALVLGSVSQSFIHIPVLGFMVGSLVGSIAGSFAYSASYKPVMSFCISTGFTMFGLVEQNYELPEDVIKEIGIEVFEYEHFDYQRFEPERFSFGKFEIQQNEVDRIELPFLRRGVIGINAIGYI